METIGHVLVPEICDSSLVCKIENRRLSSFEVAHADARLAARIREQVESLFRNDLESRDLGRRWLSDGAVTFGEVAKDLLDGSLSSHFPATSDFALIPLVARGAFIGLVILQRNNRPFEREERQLLEEFGRRAALAVENARLYEAAQRASALREDVLRIVSHDLRNPLNTISYGADILLKKGSDLPADEIAKTALAVKDASKRMTRMITDLLDFSSIEAGQLRIELAPVNSNELINLAMQTWQQIAAEKGVHLVPDARTEQTVSADINRILQVLGNLIDNSVKHSPKGGKVTVGCVNQGSSAVLFWVLDEGKGIPLQNLEHIFDRYWRLKSEDQGSFGLGLAIAKLLVESHHGKLWAESEPGMGATFKFTLPVK